MSLSSVPPMRDWPLVVEELLVEADELHREGAPAGEVDDLLVLAEALRTGLIGAEPPLPGLE